MKQIFARDFLENIWNGREFEFILLVRKITTVWKINGAKNTR